MVTLLNPIVDTTENAVSIPIKKTTQSAIMTVIFSIYVPNLQPEDVVFIQTQFEVTSNYNYTPGLGRYIVRATSATGTSGVEVTRPVINGIMRQEHHDVILLMGVDSQMPAGNYYYNIVTYAVSGRAGTTDALIVEQGYGTCTAMVFDRP